MPTPKSEKTGRPALKAVEDDNKVLRRVKKIEARKQDLADAQTAVMSEYKAAEEDDQLNTAALKLIVKLRKQDEQKTAIFLKDFVDQGISAGLLKDDSKLVPTQGELFQGKPAA
mgnify:CR=1 FL=1